MATRALHRAASNNLKASGSAAPIYVDTDDNSIKVIPGGFGSSTEVVLPTVAGSGSKIAAGTGTLDGSNPTTISTGLTSVLAFTATKIDTDGVGAGTAFLTHGTPSGGSVDVYAWVAAGTASTSTETFSWIAVGT
jgi:hypothetical protein